MFCWQDILPRALLLCWSDRSRFFWCYIWIKIKLLLVWNKIFWNKRNKTYRVALRITWRKSCRFRSTWASNLKVFSCSCYEENSHIWFRAREAKFNSYVWSIITNTIIENSGRLNILRVLLPSELSSKSTF